MIENYDPSVSFHIAAYVGLIVAVFAYRLDASIEKEGLEDDDKPKPFVQEVKRNLSEIKQAMQVREYYHVIVYLLLTAVLVPSFNSFGYFFMLDVVEISPSTYSLLGVLGYFYLGLSSMLYGKYFTNKEYSTVIKFDFFVGLLFAPLEFMFIFRVNQYYGIPDLSLIMFTGVV